MPLMRNSLVNTENVWKKLLNKNNHFVRGTSARLAVLGLILWVAFLNLEGRHLQHLLVTEEAKTFFSTHKFQEPKKNPTHEISHPLKNNLFLEGQNESKATQFSIQSGGTISSKGLQVPKLLLQNTTKVVFYHVYLPLGDLKLSKNALGIVKEQIEQMGNKDVTLLYNTIGDPNALSTAKMNQWCRKHNLNACHHMNHHASASEEVSLQNVHQFCQKWPNQRVGYVHNKGSFHPSPHNEIWRYLMTEALMRKECWNAEHTKMGTSDGNQSCNACGLFFSHEVGAHFSGNVWSAECSYINKLIPPQDFDRKSTAALKDALLRKELGQFVMSLKEFDFEKCICWAGIGRCAAEFWIGSHPTIQPCDFSSAVLNYKRIEATMSPPSSFFDWLPGLSQSSKVEGGKNKEISALKLFWRWMRDHERLSRRRQHQLLGENFTPRAPGLPYRKLDAGYWKMREYYSLGGRIHRWLHLYGQLPPQDSWAWTSYPNGKGWGKKVGKYGLNVLENVLPIHNDEHHEKSSLVAGTSHWKDTWNKMASTK